MTRMRGTPRAAGSSGGSTAAAQPAPAAAATVATAKAAAVRYLARREYSRAELTLRLRRKGLPEDLVARALDDLAAAGYLSDQRVADATVAARAGRFGRRAIVHALKEKGIGAADIDAALAPLAQGDELSDARAVWQQRFGAPPSTDRDKARHVRFLQARGYSLSVALRVLRSVGSNGRSDDASDGPDQQR